MEINILPDLDKAAAPFTTVLTNALKLATTGKSDSIIQYSAPARISPPCLVDALLAQYEHTYKILGTTNSLIAAYYMQAVQGQINISAMRLLKEIDNLRPDRDMNAAIYDFVEGSAQKIYKDNKTLQQRAEGRILEVVGESLSLPVPGSDSHLVTVVVTEAAQGEKVIMRPASKKEQEAVRTSALKVAEKMAKTEFDRKMIELRETGRMAKGSNVQMAGDLLDAPNLAAGRIFEITADYGGGNVTIQVLVSLNTKLSSSANLVDIYATGGELRTFKERWHGWMAGELRFLEDIILCSDLIDNHKRTAIRDQTGTYQLNRERDTQNRVAALLSGKVSVGTASTISLIAAPTAKKIEATIGGKLSDFATREKMFKRTYTMILAVVDTEWDQITVYHRGIAQPTEMPVSEYARSKSKAGSDVADIVKLFLSGSAPTL